MDVAPALAFPRRVHLGEEKKGILPGRPGLGRTAGGVQHPGLLDQLPGQDGQGIAVLIAFGAGGGDQFGEGLQGRFVMTGGIQFGRSLDHGPEGGTRRGKGLSPVANGRAPPLLDLVDPALLALPALGRVDSGHARAYK
jgi:hypothetical protein